VRRFRRKETEQTLKKKNAVRGAEGPASTIVGRMLANLDVQVDQIVNSPLKRSDADPLPSKQ